jgi:hypothetical protein
MAHEMEALGAENPGNRPFPAETQTPLVQDMYATCTRHVQAMLPLRIGSGANNKGCLLIQRRPMACPPIPPTISTAPFTAISAHEGRRRLFGSAPIAFGISGPMTGLGTSHCT